MGEGHSRLETVFRLGGQKPRTFLREKDLGVSIVPSMSLKTYMNHTVAVTNASLANLRISFRNINNNSLMTIYSTYIWKYAAPVWNPYLIKYLKKMGKSKRLQYDYSHICGVQPMRRD